MRTRGSAPFDVSMRRRNDAHPCVGVFSMCRDVDRLEYVCGGQSCRRRFSIHGRGHVRCNGFKQSVTSCSGANPSSSLRSRSLLRESSQYVRLFSGPTSRLTQWRMARSRASRPAKAAANKIQSPRKYLTKSLNFCGWSEPGQPQFGARNAFNSFCVK